MDYFRTNETSFVVFVFRMQTLGVGPKGAAWGAGAWVLRVGCRCLDEYKTLEDCVCRSVWFILKQILEGWHIL